MSFRDLVHNIRMSHALTLLQNTADPVLHVAVAAAYASSSRLAARFAHASATSPPTFVDKTAVAELARLR